jgi:hypothetical protein
MKSVLVCQNPDCRTVIDLGKDYTIFDLSAIGIKQCPECGGDWGTSCPYCDTPLAVIARPSNTPSCSSCRRTIRPESHHGDVGAVRIRRLFVHRDLRT